MTDTEIERLFNIVCEGLESEAPKRQRLFEEANKERLLEETNDKYLFSLVEEREIGIATVLAWYLTQAEFFTRMDWYLYDNNRIRPDLTVWLRDRKRLLYLELKLVGGSRSYSPLWDDLDKLEKISEEGQPEENRWNGLLVVGFDKHSGLMERLQVELKG